MREVHPSSHPSLGRLLMVENLTRLKSVWGVFWKKNCWLLVLGSISQLVLPKLVPIFSYLFHFQMTWPGNGQTHELSLKRWEAKLEENRSHKKNPALDSFGLISGSFKLPPLLKEKRKWIHEFLSFQSSSFYKYGSSLQISSLEGTKQTPHWSTSREKWKQAIPGDSSRDLFIPYLEVMIRLWFRVTWTHHPKKGTIAELPGKRETTFSQKTTWKGNNIISLLTDWT